MARHGPLKKPSMAQMPVLLFLADNPELLLCSSAHGGGIGVGSYHFADKIGKRYNGEDAPEIPKSLAFHRWMQSDWLKQHPKKGTRCRDDDTEYRWAWYEHPYEITPAGIAMANAHREAYQEHLDTLEAERKRVDRLVIVKARGGWRSPNREYGALVRVVRETAARIYVELVEGQKSYEIFHGRPGHEYVNKDDITTDHATHLEYQKCRIVEDNHLRWLDEVAAQEKAEIDEIKRRFKDRREQSTHGYRDEIREAVQSAREEP